MFPFLLASYTVNLAWLKSSTTEPQQLEYFKSVFLIILNVPLRTVFAETVTYVNYVIVTLYDPVYIYTVASLNFYAAMHPCTLNSFSCRKFLIHTAGPKIRGYHCTNVH